jgi:hypothetical protein
VAASGATGDAVGISIGERGASALVRSGSSGRAAAVCTHCSLPGGDTVANAQSGHTGNSYSVAVAGQDSFANASSGNSGDTAAWAVHGTGALFVTGHGTKSSPNNVVQSGDHGRVYVTGQSGDTGDVVATATDLLTWVSVITQSGNAGFVVSTARWDAGGCTLVFATFTVDCSQSLPREPVSASGTQIAPDPVVSAPEQAAIIVRSSPPTTIAPALGPVLNAGSAAPPVHTVHNAGAAPGIQAAGEPVQGQGTNVSGGARTQLVSNDRTHPAVSNAVFGSLTSWWVLLTLCMFAMLLVALLVIACRYGRPRSMNTS